MSSPPETAPGEPWSFELRSGPPHGLELRIAGEGSGLRCRLTAAGRAGGAADDGELARQLAHRLGRAARREVACELSLGAGARDVALLEAVEDLARQAARTLEEARLAEDLRTSPTARALLAPGAQLRSEVEALLASPLSDLRARLGPQAARIAAERFSNQVRLFAPLYLSDACQNDCAYCGFRRSHARRRVHLSREEALAEARVLAETGLRAVDLVTGEVPSDRFIDEVARTAEAILDQTAIERVNFNLGALSLVHYRRLRASGAVGYHLYQETYDPAAYLAVHLEGPKRDMAWRLEAPERALEAGFEYLGLGLLLGLAEPAADLAALIGHGQRLLALRPELALGFSLPRLRTADPECSFREAHPVDDALFERCLLVLRTRFPAAHLTLTTRESPELRDRLLGLGITKLSAGVSTAPGGYAGTAAGSEQFSIGDRRSPAEVAAAVRAAGLEPVL